MVAGLVVVLVIVVVAVEGLAVDLASQVLVSCPQSVISVSSDHRCPSKESGR